MPEDRKHPTVEDPDNVPEILCDGQFTISLSGELATLTFTHVRRDAAAMFGERSSKKKGIVRARIVLPTKNLAALRNIIGQAMKAPEALSPPAGGAARH